MGVEKWAQKHTGREKSKHEKIRQQEKEPERESFFLLIDTERIDIFVLFFG
jgi:hypothetical protein